MKLSIIIISFNTREILKDCLLSIQKASLKFSYEIIVVDNDSKDGSVDMVRESFPEVVVLANKQNNLFAKANNQAASIANGDYLLLLNSDTVVESGNIEKLLEFLDAAPENIVCAGPTVLNPDRSLQSSGYPLPSVWERISLIFRFHRIIPKKIARIILPIGMPGLYDKCHRTGWISGCCMLIRKDIYLSFRGLNEELEFYGEEPEFCFRLNKYKYQTWIVPDSTIIHLGGQSVKNNNSVFLQKDENSLRRYAILQKNTVGFEKAVLITRVTILCTFLKHLFYTKDKRESLSRRIEWEKKVLRYLKQQISTQI